MNNNAINPKFYLFVQIFVDRLIKSQCLEGWIWT